MTLNAFSRFANNLTWVSLEFSEFLYDVISAEDVEEIKEKVKQQTKTLPHPPKKKKKYSKAKIALLKELQAQKRLVGW